MQMKLQAILRTRRFNSGAGLVALYKAQLLSFIEYRTSAIYHTCDSALTLLDAVQDKLLQAAGVSKLEALNEFSLAPLTVRRDIAMLGIIHRTVLGRGPVQFQDFFKAEERARREGRGRHALQLLPLSDHVSDFVLPGSRPANYIRHSGFGLIHVYNMLPADIVEQAASVKHFQKALQELVRQRANEGCSDWELTLSPRPQSWRHPLRSV